MALVGLSLVLTASAAAQETWIIDILGNPARYWNTTVTIVGQVQRSLPIPPERPAGVYTILDESCPNP